MVTTAARHGQRSTGSLKGVVLRDGEVTVGTAAECSVVKSRGVNDLLYLGLDLVEIDMREESIGSSTFVACNFRGANFERADLA